MNRANLNIKSLHLQSAMNIILKDGKAIISMEGYISEILKLYNVEGSRATPATNELFIDEENTELIES